MNKNAAAAETHLKVVGRPSLYTTEPSQNIADKNVSILASLEADNSPNKISRTWLVSISIAVLVSGLLYWAHVNSLFQQPLVMPAWMETALNISKAPIPVVPPGVQPAITKQESLGAVAATESHPATIVTETPQIAGSEPAISKPETSEKMAKLDPEIAKKKSLEQQPAVLILSEKLSVNQKPDVNESTARKNAAASKVDAKSADTTHTNKQSKAEAVKGSKDEDVDLIAALLSRVSRADSAGREVKPKKVSAAGSQNATSANTKRQNKADPNRDIVTRADGDSTEGLLKRCKALGFFEGELCRMRICSSLWGKDPACPAPDQVALPNSN